MIFFFKYKEIMTNQIAKQMYLNDFREYLQISNDNKFISDLIYLDQSNIHGIGVFAKQNIKKGELITLYPAHYITIKDLKIRMRTTELKLEKHIFLDYSFAYNNNIIITGNPLLYKDENNIAHLCNDGYKHNYKTNNKKNRNNYNKKSKEYNNSSFRSILDTNFVGLISTKDIKSGEEILVPYGFSYWLRKNTFEDSNFADLLESISE